MASCSWSVLHGMVERFPDETVWVTHRVDVRSLWSELSDSATS